MKYLREFRNPVLAKKLVGAIEKAQNPEQSYKIMEFCGGHTHAIFRYGLQQILPKNIHFIHGPGCPVCVLPIGRVDNAIQLATQENLILCSYGDMLRVPGSHKNSLMKARSEGADVRMVYSSLDALEVARRHKDKQVVFFAIGFETTTPATAACILQAKREKLTNFSVFCNHVLTPPAIKAILLTDKDAVKIDGFLGPSHVSTIIGSDAYSNIVRDYQKPIVIAGFEPLDILQSVLMLVKQLNEGRCELENEYTRAVSAEGNVKAQKLVSEVMCLRDSFDWRGLGVQANSALKINSTYAEFDAEQRYSIPHIVAADLKGCDCADVLRGVKNPTDCRLFGTVCVPDNPMGSCMVSSEGACAAYWSYARHTKTIENAIS